MTDTASLAIAPHPHGVGEVIYIGGEWIGFVHNVEPDIDAARLREIAKSFRNKWVRVQQDKGDSK